MNADAIIHHAGWVLFVWVFPRIAPLMPFNDNTVDPSAGVLAHVREV